MRLVAWVVVACVLYVSLGGRDVEFSIDNIPE
jgi:hypothetical protein